MADMKLIGSKFLELDAKRDPDFSGKLELKTNIKIDSLEKIKKQKGALKVTYVFEVNYGTLGSVRVKGILFISSDSKTVEAILESKEKKQYDSPEYMTITNSIIQKASIKAFELEEELGLPIHIKLPSLSPKK